MFKKLKQKIESESEGEQSPVSKSEKLNRRSNEVSHFLINIQYWI